MRCRRGEDLRERERETERGKEREGRREMGRFREGENNGVLRSRY
jgi:hypothetical protein